MMDLGFKSRFFKSARVLVILLPQLVELVSSKQSVILYLFLAMSQQTVDK